MELECYLKKTCIQGKYCDKPGQEEHDRDQVPPCYAQKRRRMVCNIGKPIPQTKVCINLFKDQHWTDTEIITMWKCPACDHHIIWNNQEPHFCAGCGSKIEWKERKEREDKEI